MKVSELTGAALDWAVAKCEGVNEEAFLLFYEPTETTDYDAHGYPEFHYSTVWAQGGPIIEREGIELLCNLTKTEAARFKDARADWQAFYRHSRRTEERQFATTPLIAAMRAYVSSKFGDDIELPEGLV